MLGAINRFDGSHGTTFYSRNKLCFPTKMLIDFQIEPLKLMDINE